MSVVSARSDMGDVHWPVHVHLLAIVSSVIFNVGLYKSLASGSSPLMKSYVVSTIHAFVSVLSVANHLRCYEINLTQVNRIVGGGLSGSGDEWQFLGVCYSCGYFTFDLLLMLTVKSVRTGPTVFHHLLILVTFLFGKARCSSLNGRTRTCVVRFVQVCSGGSPFRVTSICLPKNSRRFR
jgi:hypothetical protein